MLIEIGTHIRQERKRQQMTQSDLAHLVGMSRATLSQIENGIVPEVGVRKLERLLDVLGLEIRVRKAGTPPTLDELREETDL